MAEVTLTAAARSALLSLGQTGKLIQITQNRLASGLRVASAVDDAGAFFEAKALNDRAADFTEKKDKIDQAISSLTTALESVDAIDSIVRQMKGLAIAAKSATGTELADTVTQFNDLRLQIDLLTEDSTYQGTNLIDGTGTTLKIEFSNLTTSILSIASVDLTKGSLGLDITVAAAFSLAANIGSSIAELDAAITTLRGKGKVLGSNVSFLQTRLDFTERYASIQEDGATKLTLADINTEGANLVALQTRQQLGISALAFAGQSEQSILSLFR